MEEDYPSDSDTSDEDYIPCGEDADVASEDEASAEEEKINDGSKDEPSSTKPKRKAKGKKNKASKEKQLSRKRTGGIKLEEEVVGSTEIEPTDDYNKQLEEQIKIEHVVKKEEEEKKRADSLWADFMSDVGGPKPKARASTGGGLGSLGGIIKPVASSSKSPIVAPDTGKEGASVTTSNPGSGGSTKPGKVTITKEYDFAGEVIKVTREVDADSKEAKAEQKKRENPDEATPKVGALSSISGLKRPLGRGGGLGSVLGKISKKPKMGTLEKSKIDWDQFKETEGISEELKIHNRGKEGYTERMAFLERADVRQFEIERNIRLSSSSKR